MDEIDEFWDARYLSAGEAAWRIMGFHVTKKEPAVTALPIHLPDATSNHQYHRSTNSSVLSQLNRYFLRPTGSFTTDGTVHLFDDLTYADYYTHFRLAKYAPSKDGNALYFLEQPNDTGSPRMHVIMRSGAHSHVTRMRSARPSQGELFYLRTILQNQPCRSFKMARTVGDTEYGSFQEAARELGLFADRNEATYAMLEAIQNLRTPRELRVLFVHLLVNECVDAPLTLWDIVQEHLAYDFILKNNNTADLGINLALDDISHLLEEYGKRLSNFGLPEATIHTREVQHELLRWSAVANQLQMRAEVTIRIFNADQLAIYAQILSAITDNRPLCIFIDGKAGRGKTTLVNALCDKLRSMGRIVIPTATSAFAAQLYPGGRTTHSAFKVSNIRFIARCRTDHFNYIKVPVNNKNEMLESPIDPSDPRGELLKEAALIIWDEAPMANRAVLACVEETCRRVMGNELPFGGKVIILLGDFRQTCPVVRRGSRAEVVDASIKSSPLFAYFSTVRLTIPIRNAADPQFASFVDTIGDGAGPEIPLDMLTKVYSMNELIDFVYPSEILANPIACLTRAILCPTNQQVDSYNNTILCNVQGTSRTYLAADSLKEVDEQGLTAPDSILDYVAQHTPPGLPPQSLTIKTNAVFRLLRNLSVDRGLVKNVRVVVAQVGTRLITVGLLKGVAGGMNQMDNELILIPRICFTTTLASGHTLLRRQFPLAPAYSTTFNSCQGLTLDMLGVDLTRPVFSHGQLYTALSRIRHRSHAKVRLRPGETTTTNVTYHEILV